MKKVLILGSGLVARPIIRHLLECGYHVTIASNTIETALSYISGNENGIAVDWSIEQTEILEKLIEEHDITVSLLPFIYHVTVAKICIRLKKNMLTSSYVSKEMKELDSDAKEAGIIIMNEMGLDPGIDHMSAKKVIDHVHEKRGKILEFFSLCGALPAPEAANNPFKYKFSWSPRGVILAGKNSACYKLKGETFNIPGKNLFKDVRYINFPGFGKMEVYPNRDSIPYLDLYNIEEAETIMRGTIRFPGWCEIMDSIKSLNFLSDVEINSKDKSFADVLAEKLGVKNDENLRKNLADFLNADINSNTITAFEWAGFLSNMKMEVDKTTPFDIVADLMIPKMLLQKNERDLVLMLHVFRAQYQDGTEEIIQSSMVDYGQENGDTAVARTVALPAAIGVKMILSGKINLTGVHIPVIPEVYIPVLAELESMGIMLKEEFNLKEMGIS